MASVISKHVPGVNITAQPTGGSIENLTLMSRDEMQLGLVSSDVAVSAVTGTNQFEGNPLSVRAIIRGPGAPTHLMVRADSTIQTVYDLRGKRVAVGAAGTGAEMQVDLLLQEFGLERGRDYTPEWLGFNEAAQALQDRRLDAVFQQSAPPGAAVVNLVNSIDLRFITFDVAVLESLKEKHPFISITTIPAGTYAGQTQDIQTFEVPAYLVALDSLDEDLVYKMTSALLDASGELAETHPTGRYWGAEYQTATPPIPFHPGAERAFREHGILK